MSKKTYQDVNHKDIKHLFNGDLILFVTATDIETRHLHKKITPLNGYNKIIRVFDTNITYYIGLFCNYRIAHVECAMGSVSRDGSITTVSNILRRLKCKVVIMVGIGFGVDDEEQNIGDVLISESVLPHNIKRVGTPEEINRCIEAPSSQLLLNRFKSIIITWEHLLKKNNKAKLIFTRILSGEELVDNIKYRNKLTKKFPQAKGGEMEGAGIYAACGDKIDWILVKGVCDFADGNKGHNKKINQQIAITSAVSACAEVFSSSYAFKDLNISPVENIADESLLEKININEVLFDYYDLTKEKYYVLRNDDDDFNQMIKQYGIWIHGPSGCGKSNLIIRNLLKGKNKFIQVNLTACIGQDINIFFKEILYELTMKVGRVHTQIQSQNFVECSKAIIELLNKHFQHKDLIIFIEEIPISSSDNEAEFAEKIFSLIISKNLIAGLSKIKFVLSSINNPTVHIKLSQQKIHQNMNFLSLEYWKNKDIETLIDMILKEFNIMLTSEFREELINTATGSPRFIKKYFRNISALNKTDYKTLKTILKETERELRQFNNA